MLRSRWFLPAFVLILFGLSAPIHARPLPYLATQSSIPSAGKPSDTLDSSLSPKFLASLDPRGGEIVDAVFSDSYAYLAQANTVTVVDLHDAQHPTRIGQFRVGALSFKLAMAGTIVFVDTVQQVLLVDVSHPAQPTIVGRFVPPHGPVYTMHIVDDMLYVGASDELDIVDVSDPMHPALRGTLMHTGITDIRVHDGIAYMATGPDGLNIIDVHDATHPRLISNYSSSQGDVVQVKSVTDGIVVIGTSRCSLRGCISATEILNVTDAAHPTTILSMAWLDILINDRVAYAKTLTELQIYNLADLLHPTLVGTVALSGSQLQYSQGFVYVSRSDSTDIQIVDVHDPQHPVIRTPFATPIQPRSIFFSAGYLYAFNVMSLVVVDVRDPIHPMVGGSYSSLGYLETGVQTDNGYAYAWANGSVLVYDVRAPASPTLVASIQVGGNAKNRLVLSGDRLYVMIPGEFMIIVDVHNPRSPAIIYRVPTTGSVYRVSGNQLYLSGTSSDLKPQIQIVDAQDPKVVGTYTVSDGSAIVDFAVVGDYIYLMTNNYLETIDIHNPAQPVRSDIYQIQQIDDGFSTSIQVDGAHLVLDVAPTKSLPNGGLMFFGLDTPAHPKLGGTYVPRRDVSVTYRVVADLVYLKDSATLQALDISDIAYPKVRGSLTVDGRTIDVIGSLLYLSGGGHGLQAIDVNDPDHLVVRVSYADAGPIFRVDIADHIAYADVDGEELLLSLPYRYSTTLTPSGGTLDASEDATSYTFAAGTFPSPTTMSHTTRLADALPSPGDLASIDHAFDVAATNPQTGQAVQPTQSYSITISYRPDQVGAAVASSLAVYSWQGGHWIKEASSHLNATTHSLTVKPNHVGLFAVLGTTNRVYLPVAAH